MHTPHIKRAVIVGATSGIGCETARLLLADGWKLGIAGRRKELLEEFRRETPGQVCTRVMDVCRKNAGQELEKLTQSAVFKFHKS